MTRTVAVFCFVLCATAAHALLLGEEPGPVPLQTLDGTPITLDHYDERTATAIVFLSARSPAVRDHFDALHAVYTDYRLRDILFVGVCSDPNQSGDELRDFSQRSGSIMQMYRDPEGKAAEQFGATVTPEVFLLDKYGGLVYHGNDPAALEAACKALIEKTGVPAANTRPIGDPIDADLPLLPIADPFGHLAYSAELVFDTIPGVPVHHCSTLAEAPNGDLLCLWYGGSFESADDQALYLARQAPGSREWSTPENILSNQAQPPGNAVIFTQPDGRVAIIWGRMEGTRPVRRGGGWSACRLFYRSSGDNGHTWSEDRELPGTFHWLPRNLPITLPDGTFVLPISGEAGESSGSFLLAKHGDQWEKYGAVIPAGSQPTTIIRDNGDLLTLLRGEPRIRQSISNDNGLTWSEPVPTDLPNPGAGIAMTKLASGRLVLIFNNSEEDRSPINLIQSTDDGETWTDLRTLESDPGEYSYPCVMQTSDGAIHITYTYRRMSIKHTRVNENWLVRTGRPN